jgi:hypothetical protein
MQPCVLLCFALHMVCADGSRLLLGGSTLTLWDLQSQQRVSRLTGHPVSRHSTQGEAVLPTCAAACVGGMSSMM